MNRRMLLVFVTVSVAALGISACDSSSSSKPTTTPTTPPTTTAPAPPAPDCGNPVQSIAPTGPNAPAGQMTPGTFMEQIQKRGRLVAGVSADTLLFGFRNPISGQLEGFDIDVVRRISQAIFGDPNRVEFRVMTYAQRIPALNDKSVDIVADVMTINCSRWAQINFSSQYFTASQKILVRTDSKARGIADMNGKKMCVAKGSTNQEELAKNYPKIVAVPVDDISDCMVLFQQGEVESVTGDDTVLAGFVKQDPYAKIVGGPITSEPYGLGIKKDHPDFVQFVNNVLQDVRTDGTWTQWYDKWLGTPNQQPPPALYGRAP